MMNALVWLRSDLRTIDNPALYHARQRADTVSAVYIDCPVQWQQHGCAAVQRDFIWRNLQSLKCTLAGMAIELHVLHCDRFAEVPGTLDALCASLGSDAVFANREPGINEQRRDQCVERDCAQPLYWFNADCTIAPGQLLTGAGSMYQVFTPFARAWLKALSAQGLQVLPAPDKSTKRRRVEPLPERDFGADSSHWPAGEQQAMARLSDFCERQLADYETLRDYPDAQSSSQLSPYLACGVLSPRQCLQAVQQSLGHLPMSRGESGFAWVNELIWREFYRHLMYSHPQLSMGRYFKADTEALRWRQSERDFQRWCQGETGYPIIDAAMRCLNQTGWMHNRLRMLVASFLCKDLHIDWRLGEAYFMSRLIDGELCANNGGWQWAAGTGADAAPYFRVFNPTSQGKRFDPEGSFVRQWLPELSQVPSRYIHSPHQWPAFYDQSISYPEPIVDHHLARKRAIAMFEECKTKG